MITRRRVQAWLEEIRPDVSLVEADGRKGYSHNGHIVWSGILWAHVALDLGMIDVPDTLVCSSCKKEKPLSEFNSDVSRWHRHALMCAACNRKRHKAYTYPAKPYSAEYFQDYSARKRAEGWKRDWRTGRWEKEKKDG